jgi:hypothetical protein
VVGIQADGVVVLGKLLDPRAEAEPVTELLLDLPSQVVAPRDVLGRDLRRRVADAVGVVHVHEEGADLVALAGRVELEGLGALEAHPERIDGLRDTARHLCDRMVHEPFSDEAASVGQAVGKGCAPREQQQARRFDATRREHEDVRLQGLLHAVQAGVHYAPSSALANRARCAAPCCP